MNKFFIGHNKERELLERIASSGAAQRSFLLFGPAHIGKSLVARAFAARLVGAEEGDVSKIRSNVLALSNHTNDDADGVLLDMSIDSVRQAKEFLSRTPSAGSSRVVIVFDAESLAATSQNALLKTLEEPNSSATLILVSARRGALLPTILSRVTQIPFHLVPQEEIRRGISAQYSPSELAAIEPFFFSLGRPGIVVTALRDAKSFSEKRDLLRNLFRISSLSYAERAKVSEQLAVDTDRSCELLEWWLSGLRTFALDESDERKQRARFQLIEGIDRDIRTLRSVSVNAKLFFDRMLFSL